MKKRISAFLLSVVLCLGLVGTAFAATPTITVGDYNSETGTVEITATGNGTYSLAAVTVNGEYQAVFDITVTSGNTFKKEVYVSLAPGVKNTISAVIPDQTGKGGEPAAVAEAKVVDLTSTSGNRYTGGGGGGGASLSHSITVAPTQNGKITVSRANATKGQTITITAIPDSGYELDTLTVTDANSEELTLTKTGDNTCTFVMGSTAVTVKGTFKVAGAISFSDVPTSHTFYQDIMWVAQKGYMQGYSDGTFRPDNNTTRQALWMVLARIDGANPSSMSAARTWAMNSNVSDGTRPEEAMSRQQMVTMLYRYAQLKGYKTTGGTDISLYPDTGSVANYAKDAMSWAVGNGIVLGTTDGRLNPEGTALRSHFAAFLHRYCENVEIA